MLEGIGYYEMTGKVGVSGASFAGGTEIVIYGQGMSHTPSSLTALFSNDYMGTHQAGPPKSLCVHRDQLLQAMIWRLEEEFKDLNEQRLALDHQQP